MENLIKKAKALINDFCIKEYGEDADFNMLEKIPIAYTTDETETNQVQVFINLIDYELNTYINGELKEQIKYNNLEELINLELDHLDFDALIEIIYEEVK